MINSSTDLYAILGHPVAHSKSPLIHNAAFKELEIDAVYLAFDIKPNALDAVITMMKKTPNFKGCNITIPHKIEVMPFLDIIDDTAQKIGSVNTIKKIDGLLHGFNTDWYGVRKTCDLHHFETDKKALILGAGGASPAVIYGLQDYGFTKISITNRTHTKAEKLARRFSIESILLDEINLDGFGYVINTSSVDFSAYLPSMPEDIVYFDLKYYKEAPVKKLHYIDGSEMLIQQASQAFEIWTEQAFPLKKARELFNSY